MLRLRSDEQLLALFRAGSEDAFGTIHDRYRQRLFAYVRQMLCAGPRQDAEDVLQDVFVRAYGALRADSREINLRAWLYRVAHNRCIDHLRRPVPPAADVFDVSRKPLHDPIETAQRREDLARLVADISRLPEQQRSALLMREIDGMSYVDLASALDVTVPAVKSLLVRARIGLVEASEARDADCEEIRVDLLDAYDRGVKASSRARRHMRSCDSCTEYRAALRGMQRSFAALTPAGAGPLAMIGAKLLGLGGAGGGAAAGSSAVGGSAVAVGGVGACKVAAVVCTAVVATGGAVEVTHLARQHEAPAAKAAAKVVAPAAKAPAQPLAAPTVRRSAVFAPLPDTVVQRDDRRADRKKKDKATDKPADQAPATVAPPTDAAPVDSTDAPSGSGSGGAVAPDPPAEPVDSGAPPTGSGSGGGEAPPASEPMPTEPPPADPGGETPPTEH
ncbi:MAG TPA: sigma-70 family RNA polymerase sigma factor [Solirubrobacteraceae bacterium]|nr:sigma-70 family RNA polymerase sigma factor [Solirubrobacteraceae bacterium]